MWDRLFKLDAGSGHSLQHQLRRAIVKGILDGHVPADEPLPSSRNLARQLGVARNTVVLAYQRLVDENYLISRERRGYFVNTYMLAGRIQEPCNTATSSASDNDLLRSPPPAFDPLQQSNIERPYDWQQYEYPFIYGQVDPSLFPINDWREACRLSLRVDAIRRWAHDKTDHDDELLIEQVLTRVLPRRGVWADSAEVLITTGAQNALFLIAQLLIDSNTVVGMENPCYVDARNIFALFTRRHEYFPVGDAGVEVDDRLRKCKLLYVTPSHQCPTTTTMPLNARRELLAAAEAGDVWIIEDDYESELNFVGEPTPALKSLDEHNNVIYVGSLSKTLAPGLRVGFVVGPKPFIAQARALRRLMYRHPPTNNQRTVAHFLALGHHDSALLRLFQVYAERWRLMKQALDRQPALQASTSTFGGTSFWIRLPQTVRSRELEVTAARSGIIVNAGDAYFAGDSIPRNFCRLGFSSIDTDRITSGIKALGDLL